MRKCYILLALTFCLTALTVTAQIKKKSILVGGQIFYYNEHFQLENSQNQKITSGVFGISIGKAFKENEIIGLSFSYAPIRENNVYIGNDTVSIKYKRFDIGIFYRQYKKIANDFYFFAEVNGTSIIANQKNSYIVTPGDVKVIQRGALVSLTPGISYQIFRKCQLELTIPGILGMWWLQTKFESNNSRIKNSKTEQVLFYSNLNTNNSLGFLGVGFRLIL